MNREILFRGKRVDNGEWVYGYIERHPSAIQMPGYGGPWYIWIPPQDPEDSGGYWNVDPATVGEYTGLKDKDGVKIFEGDIVHTVHRNGYGGIRDTDFGNGIIEYQGDYYGGAAWMMNTIGQDYSRAFSANVECEVIGNVHDNPELLEGDGDG